MSDARSGGIPWWKFGIVTAGVAALGAAIGCWLAPDSSAAILAGATVAWLASVLAAAAMRRWRQAPVQTAALGAMGVRLALLAVMATVAAVSGRWPHVPLLVALALTHLALLVPDTLDAQAFSRRAGQQGGPREPAA